MIKRKDLKKGDTVLTVPNSDYTRDNFICPVEVVGIGPKYISVAAKCNDGTYSPAEKFHNDEHMTKKDYSSKRLFLGTEEEYEEFKTMEKKAKELYYKIERQISRNLPYEKLSAINTIIEADSLDDALAKMHCVRLPR
jgi:hypothetical protein